MPSLTATPISDALMLGSKLNSASTFFRISASVMCLSFLSNHVAARLGLGAVANVKWNSFATRRPFGLAGTTRHFGGVVPPRHRRAHSAPARREVSSTSIQSAALSPVQNSFLGSLGLPRMPISANALYSSDAACRGKLGDNPVARASVSRHHLDTRSGREGLRHENHANVSVSTPLLRYTLSCNFIRQRPYRPGKVIVSASPFHLLSINPLDGRKGGGRRSPNSG